MIRKRNPGGGRKGYPIKHGIHQKFKEAIRSFGTPLYKIAQRADINPAEIYNIVSDRGFQYPPNDPRIKKIAKVIKYRGPCFEIREQKAVNS